MERKCDIADARKLGNDSCMKRMNETELNEVMSEERAKEAVNVVRVIEICSPSERELCIFPGLSSVSAPNNAFNFQPIYLTSSD